MDAIHLLLVAMVNYGAYLVVRRRKRLQHNHHRRIWIRPINTFIKEKGAFYHIFQELKKDDQMFYKYTRMTPPKFKMLMDVINPSLRKRSPRAIEPEHRLAVTLRFLIGDEVPAIAFAYRLGQFTVHAIVKETCNALGKVLGIIYLQPPTEEEFLNISEGFWQMWNFPHCIGAIDGKHVDAQCPPNSGSLYFNYHKRYSTVLMAVCDHNYRFILVDIGFMGKNSDGGIYANSALNPDNGLLDIPKGVSRLSGTDIEVPYFFIGDEAFPIGKHMMRPYPGQFLGEAKNILNYRLSCARRVIENTFGILAREWGICNGRIAANPENMDKYVMETVCSHNFLRAEQGVNFHMKINDHIVEHADNGVAYAGSMRNTLRGLQVK